MENQVQTPEITQNSKKRKRNGSEKQRKAKQLLQSHVTGENCNCSRFNCFENTTPDDRAYIIAHFNQLSSKDEQAI